MNNQLAIQYGCHKPRYVQMFESKTNIAKYWELYFTSDRRIYLLNSLPNLKSKRFILVHLSDAFINLFY